MQANRNMVDNSIYVGTAVPFSEIFEGKLGGTAGLAKYLETRLNQLTRHLGNQNIEEPDRTRLLAGIGAMRETSNVIKLLVLKRN